MRAVWVSLAVSIALLLAPVTGANAHEEQRPSNDISGQVAFDQQLNARVPLEIAFRDEQGRVVRLGDYFTTQPVILAPVYYECGRVCPLVLEGVVRSLRALPFLVGKELQVVAVSIDPREGPAQAQEKKQVTIKRYSRSPSGEGWHFLTGQKEAIEQLSGTIGFRYARQGARQEYIHASGIVVLTPEGRVARYFYGFDFAPRDLKLGLIEATQGKIGSPIDRLLLLCYDYDPATGKYGLVILNSLRLSGLATVVALGAFLVVMFRRERRKNVPEKESA